jgi:cytochrome c oxidase assembly protein subunit 15
MVVLGGVTRLTGSGLSMVDWRPVTGFLPPLNDAEWQASFDQYRESPEFQKINVNMDVEAYKGIFWLEYLHRLLGRLIGIVFFIPFVIFAVRGYIARREWPRYLLMFFLGGMQGVLGWYMVKSGLVDNPHVSQYRLTAHLIAAFLIYAYMFWVALSLIFPRRHAKSHPLYNKARGLAAFISLTIVSGGFVAGLKAGKIYNNFPMMGDYWIPPGVLALEPAWRNFFDNPALVQFDHRVLAISTLLLTLVFWWVARGTELAARSVAAVRLLLGLVIVQVSLGIWTLLTVVPIALGAIHQGVALLLFTAALYVAHCLRDDLSEQPA